MEHWSEINQSLKRTSALGKYAHVAERHGKNICTWQVHPWSREAWKEHPHFGKYAQVPGRNEKNTLTLASSPMYQGGMKRTSALRQVQSCTRKEWKIRATYTTKTYFEKASYLNISFNSLISWKSKITIIGCNRGKY